MVAGTGHDLPPGPGALGGQEVQGFHVAQRRLVGEVLVDGPDLLSLEDERGAAHGQQDRCEGLAQLVAEPGVGVDLGDHARVVVVLEEQAHPVVGAQPGLVVDVVVLQEVQVVGVLVPAHVPRGLQVVEAEDQVQLVPLGAGE